MKLHSKNDSQPPPALAAALLFSSFSFLSPQEAALSGGDDDPFGLRNYGAKLAWGKGGKKIEKRKRENNGDDAHTAARYDLGFRASLPKLAVSSSEPFIAVAFARVEVRE